MVSRRASRFHTAIVRRTRRTAARSLTYRSSRPSTSGRTIAVARWLGSGSTTDRNHSVEEVPQPEGRSNDTDPHWIGDQLYFRSDRAGEFNLFRFDLRSRDVTQLTSFDRHPILKLSGSRDTLIFEQEARLHLFDPAAGEQTTLRIGVASDLTETRPRWVSGDEWIRSASLSPSGNRAVFGYRGEVLTLPKKKGDPRNLSQSPAVHDRDPVWSPDGSKIAYFSDKSGEYGLHIASQDGKGAPRRIELPGAGFYEDPKWSHDGEKISFSDNSWTLYWLDVESGKTTKIASQRRYGPPVVRGLEHDWSPDSRWIAYTLETDSYVQQVYLHDVESGNSFPVTDGLSEVGEPVFDRGGKYLYFRASTDAGPAKHWFAMSNADVEVSSALYLAVLDATEPSPLSAESDEEPGSDEDEADGGDSAEGEGTADGQSADAADDEGAGEDRVVIDTTDISQRVIALPVPAGAYRSLAAGQENQLLYIRSNDAGTELLRFDLGEREEKKLLSGVSGFGVNASGDPDAVCGGPKLRHRLDGGAGRSRRELAGRGRSAGSDRAARRVAAGLRRGLAHQPRLLLRPEHARCRLVRDAREVRAAPGPSRHPRRSQPGDPLAVLGARGRSSPSWWWRRTPRCRSCGRRPARRRLRDRRRSVSLRQGLRRPELEPGASFTAHRAGRGCEGWRLPSRGGRGRPRPPTTTSSALFENTAGTQVELTVASDASGKGRRTVTVVPVSSEAALRNRDWVEGNLQKVNEATDGRVAYVYVPNTTGAGHRYFKRYFFPQVHKEAIIVDERFNGGGQVADYYIDLLRRPYISHWATRYGEDLRTPSASIFGPR